MTSLVKKSIFLLCILLLHTSVLPMYMRSDSYIDPLEGRVPDHIVQPNRDLACSSDANHESTITYIWTLPEYAAPAIEQPNNGPQGVEAPVDHSPGSATRCDTFNDSALCNIRYAMKDDAAEQQAARDYDSRSYQVPQKHEFISVVPEPIVLPGDTHGAIENVMKSDSRRQRIVFHKSKLIRRQSAFSCFNPSKYNKEIAFLDCVLDGTLLHLLKQIQFGDNLSAEQAFSQLKDLWPYQHTVCFLVRTCGPDEARLIALCGVDIMRNAETFLISRPDYLISRDPQLLHEFQSSLKIYTTMQRRGALENLGVVEQNLIRQLATNKKRNDMVRMVQLCAIRAVLGDPLTHVYATIANGTQSQAQLALEYIKSQTIKHYAEQNITDPDQIRADLIANEGHDTLRNAQALYESRGDYQKMLEYEQSIASYPMNQITQAIKENSDLIGIYKTYGFGDKAHLEARIESIHQLQNGNAVVTHKEYMLSDALCRFLAQEGYTVSHYKQCTGNQIQQVVHQECLSIVERVATLNQDSIMRHYSSAVLEFVDAARELNQANSPLAAMTVADVCWSILDCGLAACEGVVDGAVGAVTDMVNHPVQTVACAVVAPYVLAYQLSKVAVNLADIGLTTLMDEEQGKQKLADYIQPLTACAEAICSKDFKLRDAIKMGASVATQIVVQRKVLGGLGEFYNTAADRAVAFVRSNPAATLEQYAVTPDGILLRAAGGSGKSSTSLRDIGGKGPKNSSGSNKVPRVEKTRNTFKVANMKQFFKTTELGKYLNKASEKTGRTWNNHMIYEVKDKIKHPDLRRGDYFYLDKTHLDHIEVFDSEGLFKCVLNLDGTKNKIKTGLAKGRDIKSSIR